MATMRLYLLFLIVLILTISTTGCSSSPEPIREISYYFQEGERLFDEGEYEDAIESWEKVLESYQSQALTTLAELKVADARFYSGDYLGAAFDYENFLEQHPEDSRSAQILLNLSKAYYEQMLSPGRDQQFAHQALKALKRLQEKHPDSIQAKDVSSYRRLCLERLAEHELYIGQYYLKKKVYKAAEHRFDGIISNYSDFTQKARVYDLLIKTLIALQKTEKLQEVWLQMSEEFPDDMYTVRSKERIDKQ